MPRKEEKTERISMLATKTLKKQLIKLSKINSMTLTAYLRRELENLVITKRRQKLSATKLLRSKEKA